VFSSSKRIVFGFFSRQNAVVVVGKEKDGSYSFCVIKRWSR